MAKHFNPAFRQEVAELVVDKGYSIRESERAMGVGKSTVDKWSRNYCGLMNLYTLMG